MRGIEAGSCHEQFTDFAHSSAENLSYIYEAVLTIQSSGVFHRVAYRALTFQPYHSTACGHKMAQRKWKEAKQLPSMLPGPAVPGCCLVSFHFLLAILCLQAVDAGVKKIR